MGKWKQNSLTNNKKDQALGESEALLAHLPTGNPNVLKAPLAHPSDRNPNVTLPRDKRREKGADGRSTPETKLIFNLLGGHNGATQRKWAYVNPFEALNGEDDASNFLRKAPKASEGGCIFQGKKKHMVKIDSSRPEANHQPQLAALLGRTLGEKRGQKYSELHHSFFDSLGIPLPKNAKHCKARIWPVLMREKDTQKEVLVHSKNQALPSLTVGLRIIVEGEEDWSSQPTMGKLIK